MNLHEITTQGSGVSLGPVTVSRAFQKFAGSSSCLVLVSDPTVQAPVALKVWGPASNTAFAEGMVITIQGQGPKGKLEYKDYKGKMEINANDCAIVVGGAPAAQHAPQNAPGYAPEAAAPAYAPRHTATPTGDSKPQSLPYEEQERRMRSYCQKHGMFLRLLVEELTLNQGFPLDQALTLAGGGGSGLYPQSWFLEKGF